MSSFSGSDADYDAIYFGSLPVLFSQVPGSVIAFKSDEWHESEDPDAAQISARRSKKFLAPSSSIADIVVPAIPALDFVKKTDEDSLHSGVQEVAIPEFLSMPVLKIPLDEGSAREREGCVVGVASGVRSGLVKLDGDWYRLKGCGNNDKGFLVQTHHSGTGTGHKEASWREIRGSAFRHTGLRELAMTARLDQLLSPCGILSCNKSIGLSLYDAPNQPFGNGIDFIPACVVEKTIGDRRFGTHVLAGIELILPYLIDFSAITAGSILSVIPPFRPRSEIRSDDGELASISTTAELITDYQMGTSLTCDESNGYGIFYPDLPRDSTILTSMLDSSRGLPEVSPQNKSSGDSGSSSDFFPQQWTREGPKEMTEEWKLRWTRECEHFQSLLIVIQSKRLKGREDSSNGAQNPPTSLSSPGTPTSNVLAYLFSRTGYDAGKILRGMHQHRVSWGTYQDAMCRVDLDQWHCNAHANNVVIIPEGTVTEPQQKHSLLSFLDLDMAYDDKTYVDVEKGTLGLSPTEFDRILWREYVNFMEVLVGGDATTGVPQVALSEISDRDPMFKVVRSTLYDTLCLSYIHAYKTGMECGDDGSTGHVAAFDPDMHAAAHSIMRLAIIVMADFYA